MLTIIEGAYIYFLFRVITRYVRRLTQLLILFLPEILHEVQIQIYLLTLRHMG